MDETHERLPEKIKSMLLSNNYEMIQLGIKLSEGLSKIQISNIYNEIQNIEPTSMLRLKNGSLRISKRWKKNNKDKH